MDPQLQLYWFLDPSVSGDSTVHASFMMSSYHETEEMTAAEVAETLHSTPDAVRRTLPPPQRVHLVGLLGQQPRAEESDGKMEGSGGGLMAGWGGGEGVSVEMSWQSGATQAKSGEQTIKPIVPQEEVRTHGEGRGQAERVVERRMLGKLPVD